MMTIEILLVRVCFTGVCLGCSVCQKSVFGDNWIRKDVFTGWMPNCHAATAVKALNGKWSTDPQLGNVTQWPYTLNCLTKVKAGKDPAAFHTSCRKPVLVWWTVLWLYCAAHFMCIFDWMHVIFPKARSVSQPCTSTKDQQCVTNAVIEGTVCDCFFK